MGAWLPPDATFLGKATPLHFEANVPAKEGVCAYADGVAWQFSPWLPGFQESGAYLADSATGAPVSPVFVFFFFKQMEMCLILC